MKGSTTMRPAQQYHLSGKDISLEYHVEKPGPTLTYNRRVFTGRELRVEHAVLGTLVSVLLDAVPDHQVKTLSVAIPAANCPDGARSIAIDSFAVLTTEHTSIGGPHLVQGAVQTYEVLALHGNAW